MDSAQSRRPTRRTVKWTCGGREGVFSIGLRREVVLRRRPSRLGHFDASCRRSSSRVSLSRLGNGRSKDFRVVERSSKRRRFFRARGINDRSETSRTRKCARLSVVHPWWRRPFSDIGIAESSSMGHERRARPAPLVMIDGATFPAVSEAWIGLDRTSVAARRFFTRKALVARWIA